MKSLTRNFAALGLWGVGSSRLGNARSRLVRVIGRHQSELAPDPASLLSASPRAVEEDGAIRPLYGSSAYFSAYIDEELLRRLFDDEEEHEADA